LSNAQLDKSLWAEALEYAIHLVNRLLSTAIGGKTSLDIWLGGAAQDYSLLWVFGCPAYFSVKNDKFNLRAKQVCVFLYQKKYERLQTMRLKKSEDFV